MSYNASPTFFDDLFAATLRQLETGIATVDWETGGNAGASNAHGLGINIGGGELPAIPTIPVNGIGMNWTLTDQFSVARIPQVSQVIGGFGQVIRTGQVASPQTINTATNQANEADGTPAYNAYPTTDGEATLTTLDPGWVSG